MIKDFITFIFFFLYFPFLIIDRYFYYPITKKSFTVKTKIIKPFILDYFMKEGK